MRTHEELMPRRIVRMSNSPRGLAELHVTQLFRMRCVTGARFASDWKMGSPQGAQRGTEELAVVDSNVFIEGDYEHAQSWSRRRGDYGQWHRACFRAERVRRDPVRCGAEISGQGAIDHCAES